MFAIIESGGKQYKVQEGDLVRVEKLDFPPGEKVILDRVLAVARDGELLVGTPFVSGAQVVGTVRRQGKARKIIVFKYKPKKNYRRKKGHRQLFTELVIEEIITSSPQ
ncbi:MAG: 50S ribosomal protein L21 [Bacillota bacterium]|nr:50S ribosomal protein L21 [Bacillota bacterium]